MPRSVLIATASAGLALAFTALLATPSMAMSFTDYDGSAYSPGNQISTQSLAANRLNAAARKRDREAVWLETLREARGSTPSLPINVQPVGAGFQLTLPFAPR